LSFLDPIPVICDACGNVAPLYKFWDAPGDWFLAKGQHAVFGPVTYRVCSEDCQKVLIGDWTRSTCSAEHAKALETDEGRLAIARQRDERLIEIAVRILSALPAERRWEVIRRAVHTEDRVIGALGLDPEFAPDGMVRRGN